MAAVDTTRIKDIQKESARGDWRVSVNPLPWSLDVDVWLIHRQGTKAYNATVNQDGSIEMLELHEGKDLALRPLLRVPMDVWQLIVDAASETTPPTKKERVEAELDATKKHLEDMRRLVFDSPSQASYPKEDMEKN